MAFYLIGSLSSEDEIGQYPQTIRTKKAGYHIDSEASEKNVKQGSFPDFQPRYGLDLQTNSVETDILDRGSLDFGMVVSEKLKNILHDYNLPDHRFYPIDVYGTQLQYYWFHYITNLYQFVQFDLSEFEIFDVINQKIIEEVKFDSITELKEIRNDLVMRIGMTLRIKNIKLADSFPQYDLFDFTVPSSFTLVSDTLKNRLLNDKITGIVFNDFHSIS